MKRRQWMVVAVGLAATGWVGLHAAVDRMQSPGPFVLPSREPAIDEIVYDREHKLLTVVLPSGRVCELAEVPADVALRFFEVEDQATFLLKHLIAEYPIVRLGEAR